MTFKRQRPLEKIVQKQIVAFLKATGWTVYSTSQGFRAQPGGTRMTKGLPDLYCVHLSKGAFWCEVKRDIKAEIRPEQQAFRDLHEGPEADDLMMRKQGTVPRAIFAWRVEQVRDFVKAEFT